MINLLDVRIRRLLALLVDIMIVAILGMIFGNILSPWLITLGRNAQIVGLSIAVLYHGLTNSLLLKGQTLGKIFFKLQLITKNGDRVNLAISLLRSASFIIFFFLSDPPILPENINTIFAYIFTPFLIGVIYFTFIYPGYRSAHDFLFGTYVVETDISQFETYQLTLKNSFVPMFLSLLLIVGSLLHLSNNDYSADYAESINKAYTQIKALPNVQLSGIKIEDNKYTISIQTIKSNIDNHKLAVWAASDLMNSLILNDSSQQIQIIIVYGFDIKIYHSWEKYEKTLSVNDWRIEETKIFPNPIIN